MTPSAPENTFRKRVLNAALLHPVLVSLFPVVFLFSRNVGEFGLEAIVYPAVVSAASALAACVGLAFLLRNTRKAAIIVSLSAILFFSYGHLLELLYGVGSRLLRGAFAPPVVIACAYALAGVPLLWATMKTRSDLVKVTKILNFTAALLVAFSASRILHYEAGAWKARRALGHRAPAVERLILTAPPDAPNIYYIVLDAYGRADNLSRLYGYDNKPMRDFLTARGFFIAGQSRANYSHTVFSLASALNARYAGGDAASRLDEDRVQLRDMVAKSGVAEALRQAGYMFVSFNDASEISNADVYMVARTQSEFERGLWNATAGSSPSEERKRDREQILYVFQHLPETAALGKPAFVYAHVMCPHEPFVFSADGGDTGDERYFGTGSASDIIRKAGITRGRYIRQYADQVSYVDGLVTAVVDELLKKSKRPPIIVIQGDHGPGAFLCHEAIETTYLQDRLSILNAYYLPGGGGALLYDSITPVNTFRVIFRHYFGVGWTMLEDRSYFVNQENWRMTDVTSLIGGPEDEERLRMLRGMDYFPAVERVRRK